VCQDRRNARCEAGLTARTERSRPLPQLKKKRWWQRLPKPSGLHLRLFLLSLVVAPLLALLSVPGSGGAPPPMNIGDVAQRTFQAPYELEVVDPDLTAQERREAERAIRAVFRFEAAVLDQQRQRLGRAFSAARAAVALQQPGSQVFVGSLGTQPPEVVVATVESRGWDAGLERDIATLLSDALTGMVVRTGERQHKDERGIKVLHPDPTSINEEVLAQPTGIRTLEEAQQRVAQRARELLPERDAADLDAIVSLAQALTAPNLVFDASETARRRLAAADGQQAVVKKYRQGQVIVREGDPVTSEVMRALQKVAYARNTGQVWMERSVTALLLWLSIAIVFIFGHSFVSKFTADLRHAVALASMLLLVGVFVWLLHLVAGRPLSWLPPETYALAVPLASTVMLARILMNSETALLYALVAIPFATLAMDAPGTMAAFYMLGSLAGAAGLATGSERGRVLRAGGMAALANLAGALVILSPQLWASDPLGWPGLVAACGVAMTAGLIGSIFVVGLTPAYEALGFLTDLKLMELANLNHPLLRDMIVKAPGSYQHSIMVGTLSEAAAESIGCNALLCRVGSYFHDLGKMTKPAYFIENQRGGTNPHDHLTPSMSALVIANHVNDGIHLARQHGLPEAIVDMIPQHHGTSRIEYFYNKAKQQEDPEVSRVDEGNYRYPGPKPQTREAGIMMLADGVEAATRSLREPTPGSVKAMIEKIFNRCITDGQLDQCPLTLKDLHHVGDVFAQTLLAIHHQRIPYPEPGGNSSGAQPRTGLVPKSVTLTVPPISRDNPTAIDGAPTNGSSPTEVDRG
jgi:putative nucleotidyltransferase with HDIG domain